MYAAGTVTASGSTLSFARNEGLSPRMLSVDIPFLPGTHLKAACNSVGGRVLTTAAEYAAAGFGNAARIEVVDCDTCDKDAYCYAPGTASAAEEGDECVCNCGSSGHGEACVPVENVTLPPAPSSPSSFVLENTTVRSTIVVPTGVSEVTLRHVELDGVHTTIYVASRVVRGVRIVVQNVSLRNGAVLYVMGGAGGRRLRTVAQGETAYDIDDDDSRAVQLSICGVVSFNGAIVLTGTFPAGSVLTMTDSLMITAAATPLVYLPGSQAAQYSPVLVLSNLRLVQSVLVLHGVSLVAVMAGGRTVVAEGAALELTGSGVALDAVVLGGEVALYAGVRVTASDGSVLRVSESKVYAGRGVALDMGVAANASAVVVGDNTGAMSSGALLTVQGVASFVSGSWLSLRGNRISGKLLSLPSYPSSAEFVESTLTLYDNRGSGSDVMDGAVALGSAGRKFVVGCLSLNGQILQPREYQSVGITGVTRTVACNACNVDVSCFPGATRSMSETCRCRCTEGGYGRDCLPVYLPHPDGCNATGPKPELSYTVTLTETRSMTLTSTLTVPTPTATLTVTRYSPTYYGPTLTRQLTPTATLTETVFVTPLPPRTVTTSLTVSVTPSMTDTAGHRSVACPTLRVSTNAHGGGLTQNDIRSGGAVPTWLLVELPAPFRWASDPQLTTRLRFVLRSAVQPNGFSGPWGEMLRNATWTRNATNPYNVLELAVPVYGGYFIGADETIFIECEARAVYGECDGVVLGSFTIASNTPPSLSNALSVIDGVVAGVTVVAVVVTGGLGSSCRCYHCFCDDVKCSGVAGAKGDLPLVHAFCIFSSVLCFCGVKKRQLVLVVFRLSETVFFFF
ncbi:dispersed gene family protein 1 (DGF-1), partial [Trypanosoma theileri]